MKRNFFDKFNKITSLLIAAVLFLCSNEALVQKVLAQGTQTASPQATVEVSEEKNEAVPQEYEIPGMEQNPEITSDPSFTIEQAPDMTEPPAEEEQQPSETLAPEATAEPTEKPADTEAPAETPTVETPSAVPEENTIELFDTAEVELNAVTYTVTDDDRAEYETKDVYRINNVNDWLKVEALSKEFDFEGKSVLVGTPDDETLAGKYMLNGTGFTGLGDELHPFKGILKTNLSGTSVNCDCPLIAYMSSKATIEQFVLGMSGGNAGIAGTLIFEGEEDTTMLLKGITVTGYLNSETAEGVGGLFGTVINKTDYKFTIDAAKVSESEADNWGGINMVFTENGSNAAIKGTNVGTFIGKIIGNVTFNVNEDFHISVPSLYGTESTGSVVGRMEYYVPEFISSTVYGAQLVNLLGSTGDSTKYPTIHFSEWSGFSVKNIQGTGYNGGVIGYADHANIFNDTGADVLEITDARIEGGKAAGGFIGYAAYTTIDGTGMGKISVNNSEFVCSLTTSAGSNAKGYTGGFIGIYGDGNNFFNNIAIDVKNITITTASYSSNDSLKKYLGGFVGQYNSADDIVIRPDSEMVTIENVHFEVRSASTYCGGFVSYVPSTAGSIKIDTNLTINGVYLYIPDNSQYRNFETYCFGGISSVIESDNLEVKNITISDVQASVGRYDGAAVGQVLGNDSLFENIKIQKFILRDTLNLSDNPLTKSSVSYSYRGSYGSGTLAGRINGSTVIQGITVTDAVLHSYLTGSVDDNVNSSKYGYGTLIGVLGNSNKEYTIANISDISLSTAPKITVVNSNNVESTVDGGIKLTAYNGYTRHYYGGIVGFVRQQTAVKLDGSFDLSGITYFSITTSHFKGKIIGAQRDALIYMQPGCNFTYSSVFDKMDEIGYYGGIYRNETFWDEANVDESSVSSESGTLLIEQDDTTLSGIRVNGTVAKDAEGWVFSTLGDYMRFSIANNTQGYYGLDPFETSDYQDITSGTFTAANDIDLSVRYTGILSLTRNDLYYDVSTTYDNFHFSKLMFRGTFKGAEGANVTITLPGFPIYRQTNIGLFSCVNGATFRDFNITGTMETTQFDVYYPSFNAQGALAANVCNNVNVENVNVDAVDVKAYQGDDTYIGKLFGSMSYYTRYTNSTTAGEREKYLEGYDYTVASVDSRGNITPACSWTVNIKDVSVKNGTFQTGGTGYSVKSGELIGHIRYNSSDTWETVNLDNVLIQNETITNESTSYSRSSGLIYSTSATDSRKIKLSFKDVLLDGVTLETPANSDVAGLWGYTWNHTDVNVTYEKNTDKVAVKDCNFNMTSASANNVFGGLLYSYERAFMEMREGFVIENTTISAPNSTQNYCSFMISRMQSAILFLRDYKLVNSSVKYGGTMFDEIVGVTKYNNELGASTDGMGIVSLSSSEEAYSLRKENFRVYEYQADYSECAKLQKPYYNPYTRYYYDIDEIVDNVKSNPIKIVKVTYDSTEFTALDITTPEQLMLWHLVTVVPYYSSSSYTSANYNMMEYFKDCFDANGTSVDTGKTNSMRGRSLRINGTIDMTGMSFYPSYMSADSYLSNGHIVIGAHYNTADSAKGLDKIIFDYDNINQSINNQLAEGRHCVPLRSSCTVSNYYASSQHYKLHTGLFTNNTYINAVLGVGFGGSIGTFKYNADSEYSGAVFSGYLLNTNIESYYKDIVLDGLYVVNPNEDYQAGKNEGSLDSWKNYYGLLIGGWLGSNIICNFDTIITQNYGDFVSQYPNKKAASALIGRVGTTDVISFKKFEFKNMSIADAAETDALNENGTSLENIHATSEDQVLAYASYIYSYQYSTAEQGYYNFDDVDYFYGNGQFEPDSGKEYYITLGRELGNDTGDTTVEYYNTSSKVGTASNDTVKAEENSDYIDFNESTKDNYWLDFSALNYKPYIYNYEERKINVNYKSGDLNVGCGTYEDPYIISNERQLYSLYCYLAAGGVRYASTNVVGTSAAYASNSSWYPQYNNSFKTKLNEWKVNIPGKDDDFCNGEHEALTYDYEANPVTGFDDVSDTTSGIRKVGYNSRITVNLLRNAYYKITADIDMSAYEDFYGLCRFDPQIDYGIETSSNFPFTGVIIGEKPNGSAPVIKMPTFKKFTGNNANTNMMNYLRTYGFIASAKGCVLKNLSISYPEEAYGKIGNSNSKGDYIFGGIIGVIWGGDNIIDDVSVSGEIMTNINSISKTTTCRQYMGGMVGAVRGGSLILRNFSTDDFADFDIRMAGSTSVVSATSNPSELSFTQKLNSVNAEYNYINGVVGRVTNGYVLVESVDDPKKNADKDGDLLYRLDDSQAIIDFSEYDENTTNNMYASQTYDLINGKYFEDAGKIKISRTNYDFDCNVDNAKQLMLFATTLGSGGFYTSCNGNYGSYKSSASNDLVHVYTCAASRIGTDAGRNGGTAAYDVYSRCRKASYDMVGKCDADSEDYQYAVKYDNLNTSEYFEKEYNNVNKRDDTYKNYIGYSYMLSKYYDFYNSGSKAEFWIMRRSGTYIDSTTVGHRMYNLFNVYYTDMFYEKNGETTVHLKENELYDMTPFKGSFRGVGFSVTDNPGGVNAGNGGSYNGNLDGNNATIKLGIRSKAGLTYAGLFPYIYPGHSVSSISSSKELYPMRTIKNLKLTGSVENVRTNYLSEGGYAGMLCGNMYYGRYRVENVDVSDAYVAAYERIGGLIGKDTSSQLIIDGTDIKNTVINNRPEGSNTDCIAYMAGMIGEYNAPSNTVNSTYIMNYNADNLTFESYNSAYAGGLMGYYSGSYTDIYDTQIKNIAFNYMTKGNMWQTEQPNFGGLISYIYYGSYLNTKNTYIENIDVNSTQTNNIRFGGFCAYARNGENIDAENTHIKNVEYECGYIRDSNYYYSGSGGYFGGFVAESSITSFNIDGLYIDNIRAKDNNFTVTKEVLNSANEYTSVDATMTQRLGYAGGIAGYISGNTSYTRAFRVASLTDDRISATATPKPTVPPQKRYDSYVRPTEPPNPNKGERNYISNCDLFARQTGGVAGYVSMGVSLSYNQTTGVSNHLNTDWLLEDIDITNNKIITYNPYRTSRTSDFSNDTGYESNAGGVFGYLYRFYRGNMYANNINIEHNVIGASSDFTGNTVSGGVYGRVTEGENSDTYAGYANYFYNTVLKNNYIGPLDTVENEAQYYTKRTIDTTYRQFKAQYEVFKKIRNSSIDELGALARLYTGSAMVSGEDWNYSVTDPGSGEWYAQDNLYKYTKNVGTFIGINKQTRPKRFHTFFVSPKLVYDDTEYEYTSADGEVSTANANAHRPATDVGTTDALNAGDDIYAYREYTHIIYNDANEPSQYGAWDESVANDVVPNGLSYADNNDYLFAQLKNIYTDYKKQIYEGYINNADYDETTHVYKLKDNYGQDENGYTMDEVYDYIYYGYERDAEGNPVSEEKDYLSPYKDNEGRTIPMLVYKAQYGTPDTLINTIINILTNNGGQYNTNTGYFVKGTPTILNVESWKMQLKNGVATPVMNSDGTHKQGGFSVTSEDGYPQPTPSPTTEPKPQTRKFSLAHTSYDSQKSDKEGTFTVLHITYGWDNSGLKMLGDTIESTSVMTLDIPVYVSKLLEVQINMRTLAGKQLSEANIFEHGTPSGTVVLKSANTVMAEYVYDYPRTMYDSVYLKKKLTFETSPGYVYLHKNTKITLIDMTDHDKEYYYYVPKTLANPEIPFEDFVDANGNNYKTRDLSNTEDYPKLGTEESTYVDLRGQKWGGSEDDEGFISNYGIGVEKFLIIIDKSATEIDESDTTAFTYHSVCVRVDADATDPTLMERIRYDGKNYKDTELNTPTEEYPNPDWYAGEVNGYKAYNYVMIREIDDVKVTLPQGTVESFDGVGDENIGIGSGKVMKATVDYALTASDLYWNETGKSSTDQYLDFVISVQSDNKYVSLPVGTKYSLDGVIWYTIGRDADYDYGKKQIYYYEDRASKDIESGGDGEAYKFLINKLENNVSGQLEIYFDFRACSDAAFSDGNYYLKVDAYKTTKREYPVSGDYQDSYMSDVYSVYNSGNVGFALQEDDLLYRGINRYLPKVSDNGNINFKAQLDFRKYLDEDTGKVKDVVTNQYYSIGFKIFRKNDDGEYVEYNDARNRFKFYYDKPKYSEEEGVYRYDGVVDDNDPLMWGYDAEKNEYVRGISYKFTEEQINSSSSIAGVTELAFKLKYDTNEMQEEDFSNYRFTAYLYLSEESASFNEMQPGSCAVLNADEIQNASYMMAEPLEDYLIFTVARLKVD